jgi:hypothetical protein
VHEYEDVHEDEDEDEDEAEAGSLPRWALSARKAMTIIRQRVTKGI